MNINEDNVTLRDDRLSIEKNIKVCNVICSQNTRGVGDRAYRRAGAQPDRTPVRW